MPTLTVAYVLPLIRLPNASKVATLVIQVRGGHWKNITNLGVSRYVPLRTPASNMDSASVGVYQYTVNFREWHLFLGPRMGGLDSRSDQVAISPSGMSLRQDSRFVLKIPCKTRCICISLWTHLYLFLSLHHGRIIESQLQLPARLLGDVLLRWVSKNEFPMQSSIP